MRTHRLVDFYAKSLAVAGLSGLAAIGALIDHWPTLESFPDVRFAHSWLQSPGPAPIEIPALPASPAALRPAIARAEARPLPVIRPRWVASFHPRVAEPEAVELTAVALPVPGVVGVPELPAFELAQIPAVIDLPEVVETWQPMPAPAMAMALPDDGFFAGALKKTSSSVSASIGKARTSLLDAMRLVGSAVKRAF